jgi:hypothetical protein
MACILRLHLADALPASTLGATTTLDTSSKWKYHTGDCVNSAIHRRNEKRHLLPRFETTVGRDAVLLGNSTLLWCSVPPMPSRLCKTSPSPIRVTFDHYIAALPQWDLIVHNTEFHCPDFFPYELLQQELTSWSTTGPQGRLWLLRLGDRNGNGNHMGLSRRPRGLSNAVSPRGRIRTHVRGS